MAVDAAAVVMAGLCGCVGTCRDGGIGGDVDVDVDGAVGSDGCCGGCGGLGHVWLHRDGGGGGVEVVVGVCW